MDSKTDDQREGFTLAEVIVAMGILAVGLLTLLSVCSISLRYQRQSINALNAARVNDMMLERAMSGVVNDLPAGESDSFWDAEYPYPSTPYKRGEEKIGRETFQYAIYAVEVTGLGDPSLDPPNTLKKVDAYVWWAEEGQAGQKRTFTTRLMNRGEEV